MAPRVSFWAGVSGGAGFCAGMFPPLAADDGKQKPRLRWRVAGSEWRVVSSKLPLATRFLPTRHSPLATQLMGSDVWTGDSSFSSSMLMDWILSVLGSVTALAILRIPGRYGVGLSAGGGGESGAGASSSHLDMDSTDCMPYTLEDVSVTDADGEGELVSVC